MPCPNCEREMRLSEQMPVALIPAAAQMAVSHKEPTTKNFLENARADSCYMILRLFINIGFGAAIGLVAVWAVVLTMLIAMDYGGEMKIPKILAAVTIAVALLAAAMQAAQILIDIADVTIQSAKSQARTKL